MQTDHNKAGIFFESQGDSTKVTSVVETKISHLPNYIFASLLQQVYLKVGNCHNTRYTLQENA